MKQQVGAIFAGNPNVSGTTLDEVFIITNVDGSVQETEIVTTQQSIGFQRNLKKINVEDYGVFGDGSTDNLTALNDLFSDTVSSGTEIVFPKGNYLISDEVVVNYPCIISGSGGTTITQTSSTKTAIRVLASDVTIRDLSIVNNSSVVTGGDGVVLDNPGRCVINNVFIAFFHKNVNIINGGSWHIDNCTLYDPVLYNLHIRNLNIPDEGDAFIVSSNFYAGKYAGSTDIYQQSGGGLKMVNCKFNGTGPYLPSYHYHAEFNENTGILLMHNNSLEAFENASVKITVAPTKSSSQIMINGNQFSSSTGSLKSFIDLSGTGSNGLSLISVQDNIFATNPSNTDPVIKITDASSIVVSGNNSNAVNNYSLTGCTDVHFEALGNISFPTGTVTAPTFIGALNGNSATSTLAANSTQWNGAVGDLAIASTNPASLAVYDAAAEGWRYRTISDFKTDLGIPSGGETLQSVTTRGATTTTGATFGGNITANSFIKSGDSDANILLAGGGTAPLSDFIGNNRTLAQWFTNASTSGTGETDLYSYTIPANTLTADGDRVVFKVHYGSSGTPYTTRIYFGGTLVEAHTPSGSPEVFEATIMRTSSSTIMYMVTHDGALITKSTGSSLDFTVTNIIKVTGQAPSGAVTTGMGILEFKKGAP